MLFYSIFFSIRLSLSKFASLTFVLGEYLPLSLEFGFSRQCWVQEGDLDKKDKLFIT